MWRRMSFDVVPLRVVPRIFRTFGLAERHPVLAHAVMAPPICRSLSSSILRYLFEADGNQHERDVGWHVRYGSMASKYSSLVWPIEELHEFSSNSFHEEYGLVAASTLAYFF